MRLQGFQDQTPLTTNPQAGPLFETLAFAEIYKFKQIHGKDWQLYFWRTRAGEEIDFIIQTLSGEVIALDARMRMNPTQAAKLSPGLTKVFPQVKQLILVTFGGEKFQSSPDCMAIPLAGLADFFLTL